MNKVEKLLGFAAEHLFKEGEDNWVQVPHLDLEKGKCCMMTAIFKARIDAGLETERGLSTEAYVCLRQAIREYDDSFKGSIAGWNDEKGRSVQEVAFVYGGAIVIAGQRYPD